MIYRACCRNNIFPNDEVSRLYIFLGLAFSDKVVKTILNERSKCNCKSSKVIIDTQDLIVRDRKMQRESQRERQRERESQRVANTRET